MLPTLTRILSLTAARSGQGLWKARSFAGSFPCGAVCLAALAMMLTGCGGSAATGGAKAGPISMTNAVGVTGQVTSLAVATTLKLSMTPVGDKVNAGVDWTVTCGGNPITGSITGGACGTLVPLHTQDGTPTVYAAPSMVPINGAITVTATVTSNPSQSSSASFTIVAAPIAVSITLSETQQPYPLLVNQTLSPLANVANDPLGGGVIWTASCSSGACGSFNPTVTTGLSAGTPSYRTTYTAPSAVPGSIVTITATSLTDTSKSGSATLAISEPSSPVPVTINILPSSLYVQTSGSAHTVSLTAIVGNDSAGAGVDWSVSCGGTSCGVITSHTASGGAATYSGPSAIPSGGPVTITAKSTTNPAVSASASATVVTTPPILVTMPTAPPATLTTTSQATLAAKVTGDSNNLGVDWTATCVSAGACGSFNPAHTASLGTTVYTAPAALPTGGLVTITAASSAPSTTPANQASAVTTVVAQPPSLSFTQALPSTGYITATTQAPVSVTVANDVPPGGVNWSVQCGSTVPGGCGWISPAQTPSGATAIYTAPPATTTGTTVTVTATSVADPSITINSSPIAIKPNITLSVSFIPSLPAQIEPNATISLIASVTNDTTAAGVDWEICAEGCGFFTVKPAIPAIAATATTPYAPAVLAVTATSVSGWPNGSPLPYTAPPEPPTSGVVPVLAAAHADATKAISGTIVIDTILTGPVLNGLVMAGSQPVAGASVSLYAAGTSGYGSAAMQIATSTSGKGGGFVIPAGYTCPSQGSQMYLVATGGSVGSNGVNPNLALMTALGSCSNLSSTSVMVNEVTTIASAFATAQFANNVVINGNSSYLYMGVSSGNLSGLANAFAATNNLADISTGQARFLTPSGNGVVPYAEINTLADMLNACTASSGGVEGDGSLCGDLFTMTDVYPGFKQNPTGPTDTLQAAFNIGQHPFSENATSVNGYQLALSPSQLLGPTGSGSPFQPILAFSTQTSTWAISVNYSGGGGLSPASVVGSFAVDAAGNLWITDTKGGSVAEWNTVGAALSPATGLLAGGGPIAIDASGNVWISGDGVLTELTSYGTLSPGSPFAGAPGGGSDMAIDAQGNVWIANGAGVSEFNNFGMALSPAGGLIISGVSNITAVGVDSSNNVWLETGSSVASTNSGSFVELTNPGGQFITSGNGGTGPPLPQLAANGAGHIWGLTTKYACDVPPYGGKGWTLIPTCYQEGLSPGDYGYIPVSDGQGLAFDGAGALWFAEQGVRITAVEANGHYGSPLASIPVAAGSLRAAVDGSGNVWVLLADNTITEYVGIAAPVVTPIALGVKNKKLAAKP